MKDREGWQHTTVVVDSLSAEQLAESAGSLDVTQLHDQYADFVWRSLQRLGVPVSHLEDALQDVFVVVHRRLNSFDYSAKISTWLFGICLRVAAGHRRRAYFRYEKGGTDLVNEPDHGTLADPEAAAIRREAERRLERALNTMALERRAVFVMFEIEGAPAGEIAETLGVPVGTVYSRLHKARAEFSLAISSLGRAKGSGGFHD